MLVLTNIEEMLEKNVEFKDLLGVHTGNINEIKIAQSGIWYYVISFGQNLWLKDKDFRTSWWIQGGKDAN